MSNIPVIQRVADELVHLDEKIIKLAGFRNSQSNDFKLLPKEQQDLLNEQLLVMMRYRDILLKRIALMARYDSRD